MAAEKIRSKDFEKIKVENLKKIGETETAAICERFKLGPEAGAILLKEKTHASEYLQALINNQLYSDAINFLAHGLPKREAIWWGYLCACHAESSSRQVEIKEQAEIKEKTEIKEQQKVINDALELIKDWVYKPSDALRRKAEQFSEKLQFNSATAWAVTAVFWSGGSICPENLPAVMPQEFLYAKAVAGGVMLAAVLNIKDKDNAVKEINGNYQRFLWQGLDIAQGGNGEKL